MPECGYTVTKLRHSTWFFICFYLKVSDVKEIIWLISNPKAIIYFLHKKIDIIKVKKYMYLCMTTNLYMYINIVVNCSQMSLFCLQDWGLLLVYSDHEPEQIIKLLNPSQACETLAGGELARQMTDQEVPRQKFTTLSFNIFNNIIMWLQWIM